MPFHKVILVHSFLPITMRTNLPKLLDLPIFCIQSCAKELEWSLFQNSEETIHSAEKNDISYKRTGFFTEMKQKKIQNGRLRKFKMAASKKPHFPTPPILDIFSWNSHGLVLGLVELIDAKGIGLAQLIWSWGCPT